MNETMIDNECARIILRADAKTLRDISDMLIREGSFKALPAVLNSIANDISSYVAQSEVDLQ